jgi:hypothetical protein
MFTKVAGHTDYSRCRYTGLDVWGKMDVLSGLKVRASTYAAPSLIEGSALFR